MNRSKMVAFVAVAGAAALLTATGAQAHAKLASATPAANAMLTAAPKQIVLDVDTTDLPLQGQHYQKPMRSASGAKLFSEYKDVFIPALWLRIASHGSVQMAGADNA